MQIKKFDSFHPEHACVYDDILQLISPIYSSYPNLFSWYKDTFMPGLVQKERAYILAVEKDCLVGCALLKKKRKMKKRFQPCLLNPILEKKELGRNCYKLH